MSEGNDTPTWQNIMDEVVHARVWEAVRNQIIERTAIRLNNQLTLSLEDTQGLPNGQKVLYIDYSYELRSLRSKSVPFEIKHYLDCDTECGKNNVAEFERVEIGSTNYSGSKLKEKIKDGVFSVTLDLHPGYQRSVPVRTKRREVIYVPGSYNFVMKELCAGVSINLDQLPAGIVASVRGSHASKPVQLQADSTFNNFQEQILLPGQGFEFRFTPEVAINATIPYPSALREHFLEIESPTAGANVKDRSWIKGTAYLPSDSFLWIFVGGSAVFGRWRSLGNGVDVKRNRAWEVPAFYGRAADTGNFEILAIVVDHITHTDLLVSHAKDVMEGKPIELPRPIDDRLVKRIAVTKPAIQLDEFNLERRGAVLADRRGSVGDRRNSEAG